MSERENLFFLKKSFPISEISAGLRVIFIFLGVAWFISSVALLARNASLRKTAKNYIDNVSDPNLKAALLKIKTLRKENRYE